MLEAVAGPAANDPDIFRFGMVVQDEILIRGVLVLTDTAFSQRSVGQRRKTQPKITACSSQSLRRDLALHGGGINDRSTCVVRDLEAAPVIPRNAIEEV